jgi:Family of unknown function (DUF6599)
MKAFYLPHTLLAILLVSLWLLFVGCKHDAPGNLFPDSSEAPGWTRAREVRTFSPDRLSDYIDGDAEKYIHAGVRSLSTADYQLNGQMDVTVDVYTMSSPAGAKSILDFEPAMDAQLPQVGDAARLYSQSLTFRKDRYLVRIVAYQDSPQLPQAMLLLGHAIENKLSS